MFKFIKKLGLGAAIIITAIFMIFGAGGSASAKIHNGQKWYNSSSSDAGFVVWPNGIPNANDTVINPGKSYTLNSHDYSPANIRIGLYDTGSFRVRNNKSSGAYGSCQNTGSDREKEFKPGDSNRIDFILYDKPNCKH